MSMRDDIEAINGAFEKAAANRDTAGIVALYAPDAYLLPPNARLASGSAAIGAVMDAYFAAGARSLDLETITLDERDDVVIEVGRYTLGLESRGGEPVAGVGKYLQVFARQPDGSWRISYDCFNSDQPMG
jgi:uncharacterized protein (TIGR02246 family)